MNGQTFTNMLVAISTSPALCFYNLFAGIVPPFAAIGSDTPYPHRGVFARLKSVFVFVPAIGRAVSRLMFSPLYFIAILKRFEVKRLSAIVANKTKWFNVHGVICAAHDRGLCVFRRRTANFVHTLGIRNSQASLGTKSFASQETRNNTDRLSAHFALTRNTFNFFAHAEIVT